MCVWEQTRNGSAFPASSVDPCQRFLRMVVPAYSEEDLASKVGFFLFFVFLVLKDKDEAQCKQEDTVTVQDYISQLFGR